MASAFTNDRPDTSAQRWSGSSTSSVGQAKGSVFVVDDDDLVCDALKGLLEGVGYELTFAKNGLEALARLRAQALPDIILFDLAMPTMSGWEFRAIQKNEPRMASVPVVAISADRSSQAVAISAHAYLRKPFHAQELLDTIEHILAERTPPGLAVIHETSGAVERAKLATAVGHEINNPLTIVLMNVVQAMKELRPSILALETPLDAPFTDRKADEIRAALEDVTQILEEGKCGGERIRDTVAKLAQLDYHRPDLGAPFDIHTLIERSIVRVWNKLGSNTRLTKCFGKIPAIRGDHVALEQVFVNLLLNAIEAIADNEGDDQEIGIVTRVETGTRGGEAVVEVRDSGRGIVPAIAARAFEPFSTTKPLGSGDATGMGLAVVGQIVLGHGGRVTIDGGATRGAVARVFLPIDATSRAISPSLIAWGDAHGPALTDGELDKRR